MPHSKPATYRASAGLERGVGKHHLSPVIAAGVQAQMEHHVVAGVARRREVDGLATVQRRASVHLGVLDALGRKDLGLSYPLAGRGHDCTCAAVGCSTSSAARMSR